ncbi:MAG: glycosyltransferase family 2 protein [Candidatus Omnitrophota bacterium]
MKNKVDLIIPVWNLLECTRDCIESIKRSTDYPYRLIVIDNGSDAETREYLSGLKESFDDMVLIRNSENLGFVKAVNQGIVLSDAPYRCILNNDTIMTKGWLTELTGVMEANPEIGLLNPSSNTSGQRAGRTPIDRYAESLAAEKGNIQELYNARGFCMLVRRSVFEKLGPLDEIYHMGYFDDTDYCKRAQKIGFRTARAKGAYVYHRENRSFALRKDNSDLFRKNEEIFFSRWGRHLRVGYFISTIENEAARRKIDDLATDVARSGHQIMIFVKKGLSWPVTCDHFDIRRQNVNGALFVFAGLYQILRRKKKKGMHILCSGNGFFGRILKIFSFLHGADVFIDPKKNNLLAMLEKRSREVTRG